MNNWNREDEGRKIKYKGSTGDVHLVEIVALLGAPGNYTLGTEVLDTSGDLAPGCRSYLNLPRGLEKSDGKLVKPRDWCFVD